MGTRDHVLDRVKMGRIRCSCDATAMRPFTELIWTLAMIISCVDVLKGKRRTLIAATSQGLLQWVKSSWRAPDHHI